MKSIIAIVLLALVAVAMAAEDKKSKIDEKTKVDTLPNAEIARDKRGLTYYSSYPYASYAPYAYSAYNAYNLPYAYSPYNFHYPYPYYY